MIYYNYTSINQNGRTIRGNIAAANEMDLEARLKDIGLDLVNYREAHEKRSTKKGARIKSRDIIMFCIHMEQLDKAGVPILESLADLRDTSDSPKMKEMVGQIYQSVKSGKMLSAAMQEHPRVFSEVFTGLVAAGERTGQLSEAFAHIGSHLKWNDDMRRKIKKAIAYPIFLLILMMCVMTVMMLFVVPQLSNFLLSQGLDLPIHTRALIWVSNAFVGYWYLILGVPVVIGVAIVVLYRSFEDIAYQIDSIMLHMPFIGKNMRKIDLARFTHFFAVTFKSGIDVLDCLKTGQNVVSNRVIKEAVLMVRRSVSEGNSLTASLRLSNQFPSLVIRMFKVGEESGEMDNALKNINFFYEREVNDSVDATMAMIQPALTIILGALMFWITAAVFGPLYGSFSKMQF